MFAGFTPHSDAAPGEPQLWERAAALEWWLREYGKTPAEVRAMPAWFVSRAPAIAALRHEVQAEQREGGS